jgi:3-deoxy-D-manno-octulosonate 8-phosphate phosphatase (KDO 8-P phosphatase)
VSTAPRDRLAGIALLAFDVDGVFTDGRLYMSDDGSEAKAFHTQDGYGVRRLLDAGVEVAVISGRTSAAVERRMKELGIRHVYLGCRNKLDAFSDLLGKLGLAASEVAYVGDDVPDLDLLKAAGMGIAVANAHPEILPACDWTTDRPGGGGAVREVCDAVLAARRGSDGD